MEFVVKSGLERAVEKLGDLAGPKVEIRKVMTIQTDDPGICEILKGLGLVESREGAADVRTPGVFRVMAVEQRKCESCGEMFNPTGKNQKFCLSEACVKERKKAYQAKHNTRLEAEESGSGRPL